MTDVPACRAPQVDSARASETAVVGAEAGSGRLEGDEQAVNEDTATIMARTAAIWLLVRLFPSPAQAGRRRALPVDIGATNRADLAPTSVFQMRGVLDLSAGPVEVGIRARIAKIARRG